jgi:hypothetical protein
MKVILDTAQLLSDGPLISRRGTPRPASGLGTFYSGRNIETMTKRDTEMYRKTSKYLPDYCTCPLIRHIIGRNLSDRSLDLQESQYSRCLPVLGNSCGY